MHEMYAIRSHLPQDPHRNVSVVPNCAFVVLLEVTCGLPPPVKHSDMTTNCERRGCVANYICDFGYEGDPRRSTCTVDGQWTSVSLSCSSMSLQLFFLLKLDITKCIRFRTLSY